MLRSLGLQGKTVLTALLPVAVLSVLGASLLREIATVRGAELNQAPAQSIREGYPHSFEKIKATLAELTKPSAIVDPVAKEREAALQKLKAYRFLSGVPYEVVKLDDTYNELTEAAAKICDKLNKLDHNPPNPGLPEEDYQKALKGAKSSNLAMAFPKANLVKSVDMYMDDSDAGNISLLGHRRWCLNPSLGKTGFGKSGMFSAMWSVDFSNKAATFDLIPFPAKGFTPVEYFGGGYAWSVTLNPQKYQIPKDDAVTVNIFPANLEGKKTGAALELNYKAVSRAYIGVPLCLIFRPDKSAVAAGKIYLVEITGVTLKTGAETTISYPVEFVSLAVGPKG